MSDKPRQTKLSFALRKLSVELRMAGEDCQALQVERSAADLDQAVHILGARGERIQQLGAWYKAVALYRHITGKPYEA